MGVVMEMIEDKGVERKSEIPKGLCVRVLVVDSSEGEEEREDTKSRERHLVT
jgi:hypothetical protein